MKTKKLDSPTKMYLARDENYFTENDVYMNGDLNLFYDKPRLEIDEHTRTRKWSYARKIATLPSYMYPDVQEMTCHIIKADEFMFKYEPV